MFTRVFVFQTVTGSDTLFERVMGTNDYKRFDEYRTEGWRPIHWENISAAGQIQFRIVMEHDERRTGLSNGRPVPEERRKHWPGRRPVSTERGET
jgi:hypothetical protein